MSKQSELIEIWTSTFLSELEKPIYHRKNNEPHTVVFGRTTHLKSFESDSESLSSTIRKPNDEFCANFDKLHRRSLRNPSIQSEDTTTNPARLSGQEAKLKGRQIMDSKVDLAKAQEKRKRQMKYALEVKTEKKNFIALQISSITRIVVQSFRKLINCERCALFLMDHDTNELCFKPVGSDHEVDPKEIRFSASTGVAGWVATKRQALNIPNAYHDSRFNPEIDKQTHFRTRAILCAPVLSSKEKLFGVIQMVNKKKGDTKTILSLAKKKKSDSKHHGYESAFEPFSIEDEKVLYRCCVQVSRALAPILSPSQEDDSALEAGKKLGKFVSNEARNKLKKDTNESGRSSFPSVNIKTTLKRRDRRRSSVGSLVQFVNAETGNSIKGNISKQGIFGGVSSVSEATHKFQFRSATEGPQISAKGQSDPERLLAACKRKRMVEYNIQRRSIKC